MSVSLSGILAVGVSSLHTHQAALAITSHNISNTDTEGFSRQRADLEAARPLPYTPGQLGLGVQVRDFVRMRNSFLDRNARLAMGQQGKYDQIGHSAGAIEDALGSLTSPGISTALNDLFNSFHDLSTHPEDLGTRQSVLDRATALVSYFHQAATQLTTATQEVDFSLTGSAADINSMLQRVAILNKEIFNVEAGSGNNANDFRDQRDLLLDKLSGYMDLDVAEGPTGMVTVTANGETLVNGITDYPVQVIVPGAPAHPFLQSTDGSPGPVATVGGKLAGFAQSYLDIDQARASLDEIANALITSVNQLHAAAGAAFDLDGNQGVNFFTGTNAANIGTNLTDPRKVAAAGTANPGDRSVALALMALQDTAVSPVGAPTTTLNDAFTALVVATGSKKQLAGDLYDTQKSVADGLQAGRQAVSGVNMDEELSNMVSFQHAYEAAARVVTAVDEMMDTVINHTGIVGR